MPTDKEQLGLVLTEWEVSDFRDLLAALQERRAVPQTLTVNNLVLRLAKERAEEIRDELARHAGILPNQEPAKEEPEPMKSKQPSTTPQAPSTPAEEPPKRRPGRPPTGAQKASISVSLDVDIVGWLAEIGGAAALSPTVNRLLRACKDRGEK